jgi:NAD(P)-dependent dehydrogenase (short-subunit alcohol dehydrogenase family)
MRVWVIGGTSGIGRATAERLTEHEVWYSGQEVDVRDGDLLARFCRMHGPFDAMVYSAGVNHLEWSHMIAPSDMTRLYNINVVGLIRAMHVCEPHLRRVVVVGSDAGWRPMRTSVAYCASKAALEMAVQVIARERASDNFAINLVAPGMTEPTQMQRYIDQRVPAVRGWTSQEAHEYEMSMTPLKRRANAREIAEVVTKVLLMETNYLNGATIAVNGAR